MWPTLACVTPNIERPVEKEHIPERQRGAGPNRGPLEHHHQNDFTQQVEFLDDLAGGKSPPGGYGSVELGALGPQRDDLRADRRQHVREEGHQSPAEGPQNRLRTPSPRTRFHPTTLPPTAPPPPENDRAASRPGSRVRQTNVPGNGRAIRVSGQTSS